MKQQAITPDPKKCPCGSEARAVWLLDPDGWRVQCLENAHTTTPIMGSRHRAICRWNSSIDCITKTRNQNEN